SFPARYAGVLAGERTDRNIYQPGVLGSQERRHEHSHDGADVAESQVGRTFLRGFRADVRADFLDRAEPGSEACLRGLYDVEQHRRRRPQARETRAAGSYVLRGEHIGGWARDLSGRNELRFFFL